MAQNQKTAHTKELLRDALRRLLLQHRTLPEITVTELCAAAGVTRSTFYRHYSIPRDIIEELWQQIDSGLALELAQLDAPTSLQDQVTATWCQRIYADRDKWQLLLLSHHATPVNVAPPTPAFYEQFAQRGFCRQETELLYQFMVSGMSSLVGQWILSEEPAPPERFAAQVTKIMDLLQA